MNGRLPHFGSKTDFRFVLRSCERSCAETNRAKAAWGWNHDTARWFEFREHQSARGYDG